MVHSKIKEDSWRIKNKKELVQVSKTSDYTIKGYSDKKLDIFRLN